MRAREMTEMKGWFVILTVGALLMLGCENSEEHYVATGAFEADEVLVSAEANGRVLSWSGQEGYEVAAGEVVGVIDSTQLYLQKLSLLQNVRGVRLSATDVATQTAALEQQLAKLRSERERTLRLVQANAANQKQLDDVDAQIAIVESQKRAAQSQIAKGNSQVGAQSSALEIQVAQLEDAIAKCVLRSPIDGVILQSFIARGELAVAGRPLFKVGQLDTMTLRAYVPYSALTQMKLGDSVQVYVDRGKGEMASYGGVVRWISPKAEFTPKTVQTKDERENLMYAVKVAVANDGLLKIGMYGEVRLTY